MNQMSPKFFSALAVCFTVLQVAVIPAASATQLSETDLRASNWVQENSTNIPTGPCNYLFVNARGELLYYGTSGACKTRIGQHLNLIGSGKDMLTEIMSPLSSQNQAAVYKAVAEWTTATDKSGVTANNGKADNCLAILDFGWKSSVWFLPLTSKVDAKTVEDCVLEKSMGICNRRGAGKTTSSWMEFRTAVQTCGR